MDGTLRIVYDMVSLEHFFITKSKMVHFDICKGPVENMVKSVSTM